MKARTMTLILCLCMLMGMACPGAAAASSYTDYTAVADTVSSEDLGNYGKNLVMGESALNPQYGVYRILQAWFKDSAKPREEIAVEWKTTPLAFNTNMLQEGLEAFTLDYPEYNFREYEVTEFSHQLVDSYVSRLRLVLTRRGADPEPSRLEEALAATVGDNDYEKATAACQWLMDNVTFDRDAYASTRFVSCPLGAAHTANGAFAGKASVMGYVDAFRLLMQERGVSCAIGRGTNNTWAYVELEGSWYVVDIGKAAMATATERKSSYLFRWGAGYEEASPVGSFMKRIALGSGITPAERDYIPGVKYTKLFTVKNQFFDGPTISVKVGNDSPIPVGHETIASITIPVGSTVTLSIPKPGNGFTLDVSPKSYEISSPGAYVFRNVREGLNVTVSNIKEENPPITVEIKESTGGRLVVKTWPEELYEENTTSQNIPLAVLTLGINEIPRNSYLTAQPVAEPGYEFDALSIKSDPGEFTDTFSLTAESMGDYIDDFPGFDLSEYTTVNIELTATFKRKDAIPLSTRVEGSGAMVVQRNDQNGDVLQNGEELLPGEVLFITLRPEAGFTASLTVNGAAQTLEKNCFTYTVKQGEELSLRAVFEKKESGGIPVPPPPQPNPEPEPEPSPEPEPNVPSFSDVQEGAWYEEAVAFVVKSGLFNGVGEEKFAPHQPMTRAMLITVLARMEGEPTEGGASWYELALKWAVENNISDGTNPQSPISREQLVTMLWRYAGSPEGEAELTGFADGEDVSNYALAPMRWAVKTGLIQGMEDNRLNPGGEATRAQVAALLQRYAALMGWKA